MNPLLRGFRAATRPTQRCTPWEWCERYVEVDDTSPMPGKWKSDNAPWVRDFMECFADNRIRYIVVMCSAQSSKTQTLINLLCWLIAEDPGPCLWLAAAKDELKDFVRDRVSTTFHACKPVAELMLSEASMGFEFSTTPIYFAGAGSKSKTKSKPIRWLLADEVEEYPPGHLQNAMNRTMAYDSWNARKVLLSTPHLKGGDMHVEFLKGDQRTFHIHCPHCGHSQPLLWEQMKWDTNETTFPAGRPNFDAIAETIRYECKECHGVIRDTPAERKALARNGEFVRLNLNAPRYRVSFHWNAMLPPWVSWRSLVEEFINSQESLRAGDIQPFKVFVNDKLGQPWEDRLGVIEDYGFLTARKTTYEYGEPWAECVAKFMAADRQESGGEHYFWVIRGYGRFGKSRLIAHGKAMSTFELEEKRKEYGLRVGNCMIDSGWKASEVYRFCLSTGWKAFKGEPNCEYFLHRILTGPGTFRTVRRLWDRVFVDPFIGQHGRHVPRSLPLFRHVGDGSKDLLAEYLMGQIGDWTLPANVEREYLKQLSGERRYENTDPKGRITRVWKRVGPNHYLDCELMILVAALITKLIGERLPTPALHKTETAA